MRILGDHDGHDKHRGASIRDELELLGIEVLSTETSVETRGPHGRLGPFTFARLWYYWHVSGPVPLPVAIELYEHPVGRQDVRVAGHCGRPPPQEWAEDLEDGRGPVVTWYHIDSGAGMRLFVDTIRRHGLVGDVALHQSRDARGRVHEHPQWTGCAPGCPGRT